MVNGFTFLAMVAALGTLRQANCQNFTIGETKIVVKGHNSTSCNPRSGDSENMELCRLKVIISGAVNRSLLLPWEIASVDDVQSFPPSIALFIGRLGEDRGMFLSAQALTKDERPFNLLAAHVTYLPKTGLIISQRYIAPHGAEKPYVALIETRLNKSRLDESISSTIFDSRKMKANDVDGVVLCSTKLFILNPGNELAACVRSPGKPDLHFIVLRRTVTGWDELEQISSMRLFCNGVSNTDERCSVEIQNIAKESDRILVSASIQGSSGKQDKQVKLAQEEFRPLRTK